MSLSKDSLAELVVADDVFISACGMVSSLGHDVTSACAAARAGITRPVELDYYNVRSPEDGEDELAVGHVARFLTEGFEGSARLLRLASGALRDLLRQIGSPSRAANRASFYLSVPDPRRTLVVPNGSSAPSQSLAEDEDEIAELDAAALLQSAALMAGWAGRPTLAFTTGSGTTGVAEALARALGDLTNGRTEAAIVGGVDSLLDEVTLAWLEEAGRLKAPGQPTGLQPGEAAAFMMLERAASKNSTGPLLANLRAVSVGNEPRSYVSGETSHGQGLAEVVRRVVEDLPEPTRPSPWLISDHNGETYRANDWGYALIRLTAAHPHFANALTWYPAIAFGDTGAAAGAVGGCVAAHAFRRHHAPRSGALLVSSGDSSARGAVLLTAPNG